MKERTSFHQVIFEIIGFCLMMCGLLSALTILYWMIVR